VFQGWGNFGGNTFREARNANTGTFSCKMFQNFSGQINFTGLTQSFTATGGDNLVGSMYALTPADDKLAGGNYLVLKFDYFNAADEYIGSSPETLMIDSSSVSGPQAQFTATGTAPAGTARALLVVVLVGDAVFSGGAVFVDDGAVTKNGVAVPLVNASLELSGQAVQQWTYFNAAGPNTQIPRTGLRHLNLNYDRFATGFTANGAFQNLPVTAGKTYSFKSWVAQASALGLISGEDFAVMNIEWYATSDSPQLLVDSVSAVGPISPVDVYFQVENSAIAPAGATIGRVVFLLFHYGQPGVVAAPGAVFFDDVTMDDVSAPTCLADVNLDGVVDGSDFTVFINSFGVGDALIDPAADVNLDGVVDGNDFVAFINAFGAGC